jgi:hypothetical protein
MMADLSGFLTPVGLVSCFVLCWLRFVGCLEESFNFCQFIIHSMTSLEFIQKIVSLHSYSFISWRRGKKTGRRRRRRRQGAPHDPPREVKIRKLLNLGCKIKIWGVQMRNNLTKTTKFIKIKIWGVKFKIWG